MLLFFSTHPRWLYCWEGERKRAVKCPTGCLNDRFCNLFRSKITAIQEEELMHFYNIEIYFSQANSQPASLQDSSNTEPLIAPFQKMWQFPPFYRTSESIPLSCLCFHAEWSSWLMKRSAASAWTERPTLYCPAHTVSVRSALISGETLEQAWTPFKNSSDVVSNLTSSSTLHLKHPFFCLLLLHLVVVELHCAEWHMRWVWH